MSFNAINFSVIQAANVAAQWHATQRRKGAAEEPYVNHLLEVAALVAAGGGDQDTIIAALLHDAIEDQEISREMIAEHFSEQVAQIVLEVSDDKSLSRGSAEGGPDCHRRPQERFGETDQARRQDQQRPGGRNKPADRLVATAAAGLHRVLRRSRQRMSGHISCSGSAIRGRKRERVAQHDRLTVLFSQFVQTTAVDLGAAKPIFCCHSQGCSAQFASGSYDAP